MKMSQVVPLTPQLRRAEEGFVAQAQVVFRAYPELLSFSLEEEVERLERPVIADNQMEQFDLHVGLAKEVSDDFQEEICEAVSELIADVLQERPETLQILRGRTFARIFH
jgi:hypothetical protein